MDAQTIHGSAHHDWSGLLAPETYQYSPLLIQAQGPYACMTRPEFNSERASYPILTPTAAIGLLSAIHWKPQFRWVVQQIDVLAPLKWSTIRRNEAESPISRNMINQGKMDIEGSVQQRNTTLLRDVHYRIHAQIWVHPDAEEQNSAKHRDQFVRRVKRGQSFRTPFFGMREFHADVTPADNSLPIDWTEDLGIMLHSIRYIEETGEEKYDWFDAKVINGSMLIPRLGLLEEQKLKEHTA